MANEFDVFLSHDSRDKSVVETIAAYLKALGVRVWLDKDELRPGLPWHEGLEAGIEASRSVAVFIGPTGIGDWQNPEMRAFISRSRHEQIPVIPVLLPESPESPQLTTFLQAFTWVDLRQGITPDGLGRLVWGITGEKPNLDSIEALLADGRSRTPVQEPPRPPVSPPAPEPNRSDPKKRGPLWVGLLAILALATLGTWFALRNPDLYQVRLQVLDPEGRAVSDATVRASAGNEPHFLPDKWWEIQIPNVKVPLDRKVEIWVEHPDWESNRINLTLGKDPNLRAEIRLQQPHSWIRGRVVDESNHGLGGVQISPQDGLPGKATSASDGFFEIQLPVPNERRIALRAELEGFAPETNYCYAGRNSCPIVLTKQ